MSNVKPALRIIGNTSDSPRPPSKPRKCKFKDSASVVMTNGEQVMEVEEQGWDEKTDRQWVDTVWTDSAGHSLRDRFWAKNLRKIVPSDKLQQVE